MSFSLKPLEQFSLDGALSRKGIDNVLAGSTSFNKMADMPIYSKKTLKIFLQNQESFEAWYMSLGTRGLPNLFK